MPHTGSLESAMMLNDVTKSRHQLCLGHLTLACRLAGLSSRPVALILKASLCLFVGYCSKLLVQHSNHRPGQVLYMAHHMSDCTRKQLRFDSQSVLCCCAILIPYNVYYCCICLVYHTVVCPLYFCSSELLTTACYYILYEAVKPCVILLASL